MSDAQLLTGEENKRRAVVLCLALEAGGFTPELVDELYGDDQQGKRRHYELLGQDVPRREADPWGTS